MVHPSKKTIFTRFLDSVEFLGNLLPHPVTLFAFFCMAVIVASGVAGYFEFSVIDPRPAGSPNVAEDGMIRVVSLMNAEGLQRILTGLVTNFTSFTPLGTVLVAILGVGIAEHSGLISAVMRKMVYGAPARLVTFVIVFAGILSNTASELGYVVLIPLAAMIFHSLGRHPLAGLAAAFAGVSGGYSANLLLGTVDPLLSGITQEAAQMIDSGYTVGAEANWWFMAASTFLVTAMGTWVTEKVVEPKLGTYDPAMGDPEALANTNIEGGAALTDIERRGLRFAGLAAVLVGLVIAATAVDSLGGVLLNPETGELAGSPFLKSIVAFIFIFFAVPGFVYGKVVGTMSNDVDAINAMSKAMSSMGGYMVLVFFAAQFVAYFKWTNFGAVLAVMGATALESAGLTGPSLFFLFILVCGLINLSLGSASAQWAVTAPIFVPMLMLVGYSPETIQAAYRIGDSTTNLITPMMSYFGLILAIASRYYKNIGIGTLISIMLPYTMVFVVIWSSFFYLWVFVAGIPVGPGSPIFYTP